jgi:hypothetical protein
VTFHQWSQSRSTYFAEMSKARRRLIDSKVLDTRTVLETTPVCIPLLDSTRSSAQIRSTLDFVPHWFLFRYCILADRAFGGSRCVRHRKDRLREAEHWEGKIAELRNQQEERKEKGIRSRTPLSGPKEPKFRRNGTHPPRPPMKAVFFSRRPNLGNQGSRTASQYKGVR